MNPSPSASPRWGRELTPLSRDALKVAAGRIGGLTLHANADSAAIAARARRGLDAKFEREVRELALERGEVLTESEIHRRTELRRRAYYARLSMASVKARKAAKGSGR